MARSRLVDPRTLPTYDLGQDHPFARDRQAPLIDLLLRSGLAGDADFLASTPATDAELHRAHAAEYVDAVRALSASPPGAEWLRRAPRYGMGSSDNPIAPGQHEAARAVAGATLACVRAVVGGEPAGVLRAFNSPGGLHHALPAAASGFCIYNDLVLAAREAQRLGAARVLYVDLDVHHGDGVEYAFREDPSVFTYSIHETPAVRWPGTGYAHDRGAGAGLGFAMNVPVHPHTTDASWLAAVQRTLVPAARRFRPDLILSQHGCDPHAEDPLATLELTTGAFFESAKLVRDLTAELCGGRWVATGGGGYRPHHVIPRAWSIVWAVLSERELPVRVDEAWRRDWQARAGEPLPELFLDVPPPEAERHRVAARANERTVREVLGHHGL